MKAAWKTIFVLNAVVEANSSPAIEINKSGDKFKVNDGSINEKNIRNT